jgi:sarcosine oxidase subunit delta
MSFLLVCPNCGPREVYEFRYGGELLEAGAAGSVPAGGNLPGPQRERWYHWLGCRRWLVTERDVRTNAVRSTGWLPESAAPQPAAPEGHGGEPAAEGKIP